jgi:hypothetical protein
MISLKTYIADAWLLVPFEHPAPLLTVQFYLTDKPRGLPRHCIPMQHAAGAWAVKVGHDTRGVFANRWWLHKS